MAESVVKAAVIFDTAQMKEGVADSVDGLKQMAEQSTVTSSTMQTKSQAMAQAAIEAAESVSEADMKIAAATKISTAAKADLAKAMRDVKNGAGSEADAMTLLASAQRNAREASAGLAAAQKELADSSNEPMGGGMERIAHSLEYLGIYELLHKVADGFKEAIGGSLEFGEAIARASEKTGLTAKTLSVLHYAAAVTGGDFDGMSKAVSKLDKNIGDAADGNVKMASLFKSLGLDAKELAGNSDGAAIALRRVAEVLGNTEGPRRQQLAMELLGKAGAESIPTLIQVGKSWDTLSQRTQSAGMMLNGETAEALESTEQRLKDLEQRTQGAGLAFTQGLTPGLNQFFAQLTSGGSTLSAFNGLGERMGAVLNFSAAAAYGLASGFARLLYVGAGPIGMFTENGKKLKAAADDWAAKADAFKEAMVNGNKVINAPLPKPTAERGGTDGWQGFDPTGGKGGEEAARKAAEAKLHAMEEGREKEEVEGKLGAKADHDYWTARIGEFVKGSAEYLAIEKKITDDAVSSARAAHEALQKMKAGDKTAAEQDVTEREKVAHSIAEEQKLFQSLRDDLDKTGSRWDSYHKAVAMASEITSQNALHMQEANLRYAEATGAIRPLAAAQQQAAIHTAEHTEKIKALRKELEQLEEEGKNLKAGDKGYEENQTKQENTKNAIATESGSGEVQAQQDAGTIASATAKPYLTAFDQINAGWMKVQNDFIRGNKKIGQDFRQMGLSMVESAAGNAEKMVADWARGEIRKVVVKRLAMVQIAATDAAGASASIAASKAADSASGLSAAKLAFKNTYKVVSGWPVVGPVLAPVLAAGAFAAVAAFEKGGVVEGSSPGAGVMIMAHAGERVLTSRQTTNFDNMVNNSQSRGGDAHFHMGGNTIHGGAKDAPTINEHEFRKMAKKLHREGKLAFR